MSVLPPEVHEELSKLLDLLQSTDNGVRGQAEEHLNSNWTNTRPEVLLMGLVEQIYGSDRTDVCPVYSKLLLYRQKETPANMLLRSGRSRQSFSDELHQRLEKLRMEITSRSFYQYHKSRAL